MVFLGKDLDVHCRPGYGRMEIGRWVHIGDGNAIRCHEGSLRIGDKAVFGRQNVINCYLDIELGDAALVADWVYICDFDHVTSDIHLPIKDQGIVKAPVRIGPDTWLCTKVTVTKGSRIGRGAVVGAHAVVKGDIPDYAVAAGIPAKVVRDRRAAYEADAAAPRRGGRHVPQGGRGAEEDPGRQQLAEWFDGQVGAVVAEVSRVDLRAVAELRRPPRPGPPGAGRST